MKYLAFDPGNTTGYASFDETGTVIDTGQIDSGVEGVVSFLVEIDDLPSVVIIEDYRVRGDRQGLKANVGKKLETVQVIGCIRGWAHTKDIEIVMQPPGIKPIAEKFSGHKPRGSHAQSHWQDAYNHGVYYLVKNKIRKINGLDMEII